MVTNETMHNNVKLEKTSPTQSTVKSNIDFSDKSFMDLMSLDFIVYNDKIFTLKEFAEKHKISDFTTTFGSITMHFVLTLMFAFPFFLVRTIISQTTLDYLLKNELIIPEMILSIAISSYLFYGKKYGNLTQTYLYVALLDTNDIVQKYKNITSRYNGLEKTWGTIFVSPLTAIAKILNSFCSLMFNKDKKCISQVKFMNDNQLEIANHYFEFDEKDNARIAEIMEEINNYLRTTPIDRYNQKQDEELKEKLKINFSDIEKQLIENPKEKVKVVIQ